MDDKEFKRAEEAYRDAQKRIKAAESELDQCVANIGNFARDLARHGWRNLRLTNEVAPHPLGAPLPDDDNSVALTALPTHTQIKRLLELHALALAAQRAAWCELPESYREILARAYREASTSRTTGRRISTRSRRVDR